MGRDVVLEPKQLVSFEELSPTGSPHKVTCREGGIHQKGVLGDDEGGGSGDE
jgi:hypothetical protein